MNTFSVSRKTQLIITAICLILFVLILADEDKALTLQRVSHEPQYNNGVITVARIAYYAVPVAIVIAFQILLWKKKRTLPDKGEVLDSGFVMSVNIVEIIAVLIFRALIRGILS
ncbi:MAG: hypothetical protein GX061_02390 [Eubacteriaceae bacterium]|nr:hypothetical protein [Eubacteriaceae bacterium]